MKYCLQNQFEDPLSIPLQKNIRTGLLAGISVFLSLNRFRAEYVQDVIEGDKGKLSALEQQVIDSLKEHELLSKNINVDTIANLHLENV